MKISAAIAIVFGAALSTACQTQEVSADTSLNGTSGSDPRIGAEASKICFPGSISGWRTIQGDDDAIILTKNVNENFRVAYSGPCQGSDFRFATAIGLENRPGGGCLSKGDFLLVRGPGDYVNRCFITQINEWNEGGAKDNIEESKANE